MITVGVVGLGLIGGSLAKAYKAEGHRVFGYDIDGDILSFARLSGVIDGVLDDDTMSECEAVLIAVNPNYAVDYIEKNADNLPENLLVIDCCGVKRSVCEKCFPIAKKHGFIFVGGHPMAGNHRAGFKNSRADLFKGAFMLLVPPVYDEPELFGRIERTLKPVGFGHLTITTADKHDEMIAFSSQMAHIVSNAYIKSPSAKGHKGFSAGSYKDLTRVAQLNSQMWAELCAENSGYLIKELDGFIESVMQYRNALSDDNRAELQRLLEEGSNIKKELDNH